MQTIRLAGVPEHFNMPWHYAIENGLFEQEGMKVVWTDYSTGTGAMAKDLRNNVVDAAVVLTEGIIADIMNGNESRIVQWYVKSPLVWGIHTGANSDLKDLSSIEGRKYAISRFGSGSHLMAFVDASKRGIQIKEEQFVIVNNMDGAAKALTEKEADLFMWEKFTTKPMVDKGVFRRIGECPTPWPCFVIAFKGKFLDEHPAIVHKFLKVINSVTKDFKQKSNVVELIAERYQLKQSDVAEWIKNVEWASDSYMDESIIQDVINTLFELGIVKNKEGGFLY